MRRCVGCVKVEMQWARIALGNSRRLPNPNPGRCCLLPGAPNGCLPDSAHFALPAQLLLLIRLSLILPVVQYLTSSPPECSRSSRRQVVTRETAPRSSINFVICALRLQCMDLCTISVRTFLFSVFLDLCMISVRVCGMVSR